MKRFHLLSIALATILVSSCANDEPVTDGQSSISEVSDPALQLVEAFATKVDGKAISPTKLKFKEKRIRNYSMSDYQLADKAPSRTAGNESLTISTVIFDNDGIPGFAIVGESETLTKLYFYTDNGTPEGVKDIEPAMQIIESIPGYFAADVSAASIIGGPIKPGIFPPLDSIAGWAITGPIMYTQWGQDEPYNTLAPVCDDPNCAKYGQHMPIGCGAVALGQFFAQQGKYISSNGTVYDLSVIGAKSKPRTVEEKTIVAEVLYDIAIRLEMAFECSVSTSFFKDFPKILTTNGYSTIYSNIAWIDNDKLMSNLRNGYPHLTRAARYDPESEDGESNGHIWIIDGIYGPFDSPYYHCNWGWNGKGNCWTIDTPFKAEGRPNYYDTGFLDIYFND